MFNSLRSAVIASAIMALKGEPCSIPLVWLDVGKCPPETVCEVMSLMFGCSQKDDFGELFVVDATPTDLSIAPSAVS